MAKSFTIPGAPVPKPRQTQRDKWAERPCVMRYRAWADEARLRCPKLPLGSWAITVRFYFPIAKSHSERVRTGLIGQKHQAKPDLDNCAKAVIDALFPSHDEHIACLIASKYWDDGRGPRTEVIVE